jgi:putative flavoprotein involved in K+ transport
LQSDQILDAVVVGAGWAGLGVSFALKQRGLSYRTFERGRVGESWREQRWDSFHMNTPNSWTVMPGDRYQGTDPDGFMTRDQFVDLLVDFTQRHDLRVEEMTAVT